MESGELVDFLKQHFPDGEITELIISPGCGEGENFVSKVKRVSVVRKLVNSANKKSEVRQSFILKEVPDAGSPQAEIHDCERLFRNEEYAYVSVLPVFREFMARRGLCEELAFPKYIGRCSGGLVLEDLQAGGFALPDRSGLGLQECSLILQKISTVHAVSLAIREAEPDLFEKAVRGVEETVYCEAYADQLLGVFWENALTFAVLSLTEAGGRLAGVAEGLKKHRGCVLKDLARVSRSRGPFSVLCHGDLWMNNVLLRRGADGEVLDAKLIDLQAMRHSSCVLDLLHLLLTSARPGVLRDHFHTLLRGYHAALRSTTALLDTPLPFDLPALQLEARNLLQHSLLVAFVMLPCTTGSVSAPVPLTRHHLSKPSVMRNIYDSLNEQYHVRLRGLVTDLLELDVIS